MSGLISPQLMNRMFRAVKGVQVVCGSESTYGDFEKVAVELENEYGSVAALQPSVVIREGSLTLVTAKSGFGEQLVIKELDRTTKQPIEPGTPWLVQRCVPHENDGETFRVMLKEP